MRTLLATLIILACAPTRSQDLTALDIRQATGNGPYPLYISVLRMFPSSSIPEFERIAEGGQLKTLIDRTNKVRPSGFNFRVGFIYSNGRYLRPFPKWGATRFFRDHKMVPNLCFETDFLTMTEHLDGPGGDLYMNMEIGSTRLGVRYNLFYPVSLQVTTGVVWHQAATIILDAPPRSESPIRARVWPGIAIHGWDTRARLQLLDGTNAGGGLGLSVECQWTYLCNRRSLGDVDPLYAAMGDNTPRGEPTWHFITWGAGITVPLALRFK